MIDLPDRNMTHLAMTSEPVARGRRGTTRSDDPIRFRRSGPTPRRDREGTSAAEGRPAGQGRPPDRCEFLGRKVVDIDGRRDRLLRLLEAIGVVLRNEPAVARLAPVALAGPFQLVADRLRLRHPGKGSFQPRQPFVAAAMVQPRRQAIARSRRFEEDVGALSDQRVGRPDHACTQRLNEDLQQPGDRAIGKICENLRKTLLDGLEAAFHAIAKQRQVGVLALLVLPSLERGGEKVELRQDVAEAGRDELLALQGSAHGEEGETSAASAKPAEYRLSCR